MPDLRHARAGDWPQVSQLLQDAGLPVDDLSVEKLERFLIAEDAGDVIGLIGLEVFDTTGLLRSLVVSEAARRAGLGGKLVGALESAAETAGIQELWLLTIDAERFFERQGFTIVEREVVPDSIRQSDEFDGLCPDTAYLMVKDLAR